MIKDGRLLVGGLVGWLGPCWQVVIGVIYHLWKGLRAHHTNHTSARCYRRSTAHTGTHTDVNHTQTNSLKLKHMQKKDAIVIHSVTNVYIEAWVQSYTGFSIRKDRRQTEKTHQPILGSDGATSQLQTTLVNALNCTYIICMKHKAQWRHHEVNTTDKEDRPPAASDGPVQTKEGHLPAWAITATTSCLSIPRGARHYETTCQVPTCLSMVSLNVHRSSNFQLAWRKGHFEQTLPSNL